MCGIGISITLNSDEHKYIAEEINNRQSYRGPDFNLIKSYENFSICHQRLAIIDLNSRSNQPFKFKNIEISFNGEIYNFQHLRKNLKDIGYNFSTTSDTEVVAIGIFHYGISFIKKLDGMFSICCIDKKTNTISLTADPFGIKQIYYYQNKNIFLGSSELSITKEIASLFKYELTLNKDYLDFFTSYISLPKNTTPFNEIKSLCNGDLLSIKLEKNLISTSLEKSYISRNFEEDSNLTKDEMIDMVLENSFQADVNQAILLSGGIDSTNLAINNSRASKELFGYCINTNLELDGYSRDSDYAKIVSQKESIPLKLINFDNNITVDKIEDTLKRLKNVGEFSSALSLNHLLKEISNDSIKVVHSGLGADEIYGGYTIMKNYRKINLISKISYLIGNKSMRLNKFLINSLVKFNPFLSKNRLKLLDKVLSDPSGEIFSSLIRWDTEIKKITNHNQLEINNYSDLINFYFNYFLSSSHLPIADSISMSYSIEMRVPFLSRRLFSSVSSSLFEKCDHKNKLKKRLRSKYDFSFINRKKSGLGVSALNIEDDVIDYLIDLLFDNYISGRYEISKDNLVFMLREKLLVRFPYMLFSLLTYDKLLK